MSERITQSIRGHEDRLAKLEQKAAGNGANGGGREGMTLQQAFDAGFEEVKEYIDHKFATIESRLRGCEIRGNVLESTIAPYRDWHWRGIWEVGQKYRKNNFVTCQGSLWICLKDYTERRPGTPDSGWQMCIKSQEASRPRREDRE